MILLCHWGMNIIFRKSYRTLLKIPTSFDIFDCHQSLLLKLLFRTDSFLYFSEAVACQIFALLLLLIELLGKICARRILLSRKVFLQVIVIYFHKLLLTCYILLANIGLYLASGFDG